MKKLLTLLLTIFMLTGCSTAQVSSEPYTIVGNTITFNNENLSFTFPSDFEVIDSNISFGPEERIPESPTDKDYFHPVLTLSLSPARSLEVLTNELEATSDKATDIKTLKLKNGVDFVTWNEPAFCDYKHYEIIGNTNNIKIDDWSCTNVDSDKAVQDFLDSVQ